MLYVKNDVDRRCAVGILVFIRAQVVSASAQFVRDLCIYSLNSYEFLTVRELTFSCVCVRLIILRPFLSIWELYETS